MKNTRVKIIGNVFIIALAIAGIFFLGLKQPMGYTDTQGDGGSVIDIYSPTDIKIIAIDGVTVDGAPIRVQTDKPYDGLVVGYEGERIPLSDGFTFGNSANNYQSLDFKYSDDSGDFYLDRSFTNLHGYASLSLLLMVVILINVGLIVSYIGMSAEEKHASDFEFVIQKYKHLNNTIQRIWATTFAIVMMGFFVSFIFTDLRYFMYELSDTVILLCCAAFLIVDVIFSTLYEAKANNLKIYFENGMMRVIKGNVLIFEEHVDNTIYQETIVRNVRSFNTSKSFTTLKLQLRSKTSGSVGVDIDLLPFGYDTFNLIISKLDRSTHGILFDHAIHNQDDNDHGVTRNEFVFAAKDYNITMRSMTIGVVAVLLSFPLAYIIPYTLKLSPASMMLMVLIPLMIFVLAVIVPLLKKMKPTSFKVSRSHIEIGGETFYSENIQKIILPNPSEMSGTARFVVLKLLKGKRRWQLPMKRARKGQREDYEYEYKLFYDCIKENYGSKIEYL